MSESNGIIIDIGQQHPAEYHKRFEEDSSGTVVLYIRPVATTGMLCEVYSRVTTNRFVTVFPIFVPRRRSIKIWDIALSWVSYS